MDTWNDSNQLDNEKELILSFDEMDIKVFHNYLQDHNKSFHHISDNIQIGTEAEDNYGNKIYHAELLGLDTTLKFENIPNRNCMKLLANLVESSRNLFAIIDNKIRKIPVFDVLSNDIKILVNLLKWAGEHSILKHYDSELKSGCIEADMQSIFMVYKDISPVPNCTKVLDLESATYNYDPLYLYMSDKSPLCTVGAAIKYLLYNNNVVNIVADINVAVLCTLFVELCHKAGIPKNQMQLLICRSTKEIQVKCVKVDVSDKGSAAIITEHADVESAADILLAATTNPVYPWRLRRVFVQENTAKRFESALSVHSARSGVRIVFVNALQLRDLLLAHPHTTFILNDFAGTHEDIPSNASVVVLERYRSSREAAALLAECKARYVSVWSTNISVAHELAFGARATNVWINDHAVTTDRLGLSHSFYISLPQRITVHSALAENFTSIYFNIDKLYRNWRMLSVTKRKETILNACMELSDQRSVAWVREVVLSFVHMSSSIEDGQLCQRVSEPLGILLIKDCTFTEFITLLLIGNALIIEEVVVEDYSALLEQLTLNAVPIAVCDTVAKHNSVVHNVGEKFHVTPTEINYWQHFKTVCSYFGETFAN